MLGGVYVIYDDGRPLWKRMTARRSWARTSSVHDPAPGHGITTRCTRIASPVVA